MSAALRMIVGNLDCEADFATVDGRTRPAMRRTALDVASASATLLRAFAGSENDSIVTPRGLDRRRMSQLGPLPRPSLVVGAPRDDRAVLAWSASPDDRGRPASLDLESLVRLPLHESAWHWSRPAFTSAARANDRRQTLEWAERLGVALRGSAVATSPAAADSAIRALEGPWVAKAPFAAAGRWRVRGETPSRSEPTERALAGLLRRHGAVVIEPWCRRCLDIGIVGLCSAGAMRILGAHRLAVDSEGRFLGIETVGRFRGLDTLSWLRASERRQLAAAMESVALELTGIGYEGPFGIDAWRYETEQGERFHPLGEVNARMTFGLVARTLIDRLRVDLSIGDTEAVSLRFGRGNVPAGAIALLEPDQRPDADQTCAWLELDP